MLSTSDDFELTHGVKTLPHYVTLLRKNGKGFYSYTQCTPPFNWYFAPMAKLLHVKSLDYYNLLFSYSDLITTLKAYLNHIHFLLCLKTIYFHLNYTLHLFLFI